MRFSIFVNFATLGGVPLVISFKLSPTISQLFFRDSPFGHFRQIRQFRDFYTRLWQILAIFGIFAISFKSPLRFLAIFAIFATFKGGPFVSSFDLQVRVWGFLAILVNITIFVKLTTFKWPLYHFIANFIKTLANVRYIRRQLQIRHFRQICHFHQNGNS